MKIFRITMLPANEGDCLWVEYGDETAPHRLLIDTGRKSTYAYLQQRFAALPPEQREFELFVITHIDRDHIEGSLSLVEDPALLVRFKDVWFNGYDQLVAASEDESLGVRQGERLSSGLVAGGFPWNVAFDGGPAVVAGHGPLPTFELDGGMRLTLLSPTKAKLEVLLKEWKKVCLKEGIVPGVGAVADPEGVESLGLIDVNQLAITPFEADKAEANGSSIAFLAEYEGKRVLFGADAHEDVLLPSIRRHTSGGKLPCDAVKLAHHGSQHNTSVALLEALDTPRFLISTSGSYFKHPDPVAMARVIKHGKPRELHFNYRSEFTSDWDRPLLKNQWNYSTFFPGGAAPGVLQVDLL